MIFSFTPCADAFAERWTIWFLIEGREWDDESYFFGYFRVSRWWSVERTLLSRNESRRLWSKQMSLSKCHLALTNEPVRNYVSCDYISFHTQIRQRHLIYLLLEEQQPSSEQKQLVDHKYKQKQQENTNWDYEQHKRSLLYDNVSCSAFVFNSPA